MRVVFFAAGGDMALRPMEAVARTHDVVAVVRPIPRGSLGRRVVRRAAQAMGLRANDPVRAFARENKIQALSTASGRDQALIATLRRAQPDVICIATFPFVLSKEMLDIPEHGVLNLHASLLPRHRGPDPYFWTFYEDDRRTGVTIHFAVGEADAGPIVQQDEWDLPRGFNVKALHAKMAVRAADMLPEAIDAVCRERTRGTPQDDRAATMAPRVKRGTPMAQFGVWDVERVWHFLAGVSPFFREPLELHARPVRYGRVLGFERTNTSASPGSVEQHSGGRWNLHCRGGHVRLAASSPRRTSD